MRTDDGHRLAARDPPGRERHTGGVPQRLRQRATTWSPPRRRRRRPGDHHAVRPGGGQPAGMQRGLQRARRRPSLAPAARISSSAARRSGGLPQLDAVAVLGDDLGDLVQHARRGVGRTPQMQMPAVVRAGLPVDPQARSDPGRQRPRRPAGPAGAGRRGPGDGPPGRRQHIAGGTAQVGEGPVQQGIRRGAPGEQTGEFGADVLRQRVMVGGAPAQIAPLAQIHRLRDGTEGGVGGHRHQHDAVLTAGLHQHVGHRAMGLLAGQQRGRPGGAQRRHEAVGLRAAVPGPTTPVR